MITDDMLTVGTRLLCIKDHYRYVKDTVYEIQRVDNEKRPYPLYGIRDNSSFSLTNLNYVFIMYDSLPEKVKFLYELTGKIKNV